MTNKLLNMVVEDTCWNCPMAIYDLEFKKYNCNKKGREIASDEEIFKYESKLTRGGHTEHPAEKKDSPTNPNPMDIPKWCPLPDTEPIVKPKVKAKNAKTTKISKK